MAEESPIAPLAPTGPHHSRSDEEYAPIKRKPLSQEKSSKCLVYVLIIIVSISAILLVLSSIFLRANTPDVKLRSVTVKNLSYGNSTSPFFNATLVAELTIENENFGYFKFKNESGSVSYGGVTVGDVKIREGRVKARGTKRVNVTVEVRSSNGYSLGSKNNLSSDVNSGMLKLRSYVKLHGSVNLFDVLKKTKTPEVNCSIDLVLKIPEIEDLRCS
ncbi:Late embryogenesis abundant protein [Melia azedarach]|uniref:Late embryogenesis abundant protein n=1 Tax=Melia azedarach TaxID=155640 RepID=A0ACC1XM43_MELAZ|nr:Late embryogenesis abundant protein [Melia azedarach]